MIGAARPWEASHCGYRSGVNAWPGWFPPPTQPGRAMLSVGDGHVCDESEKGRLYQRMCAVVGSKWLQHAQLTEISHRSAVGPVPIPIHWDRYQSRISTKIGAFSNHNYEDFALYIVQAATALRAVTAWPSPNFHRAKVICHDANSAVVKWDVHASDMPAHHSLYLQCLNTT